MGSATWLAGLAVATCCHVALGVGYHSPWVNATVNGNVVRLEISTRFRGVILYADVDELAYTTQDVVAKIADAQLFEKRWNVSGLLGMGLVSSPQAGWPLPGDLVLQYNGMDPTTGAANATLRPASSPEDDNWTWSESMNVVHDFYYKRRTSFTVHNATVCGVPLTQPSSSYWAAHVDFEVPCLVLPKEFYTSLVTWAPLEYNASANLTQLRSNVSLHELPSLSFQAGYGLPTLTLPLAALALNVSTGSTPQLCIQQSTSIINRILEHQIVLEEDDIFTKEIGGIAFVPDMYQSPILFGAMVLQHLPTLLSDTHKQVGFVKMPVVTPPTHPVCTVPVACRGQQTYDQPTNTCKDPNCDLVYYHELDDATKTCVPVAQWQWVATCLIAGFIALEVYLDRSRRRLAERTLADADGSS
ncbi:hypothetical protein SPRG_18715 [Saprolegnia parasitica CBS 223.65]|uniref:Peptidase A1 domain-containing protein n=1 Tax=Saprolegnia parasitica (strain CBS 223.65) TaxID=695850 RepID=A0A067BCD9_SAPPC|nr:hypothetical protein SPRG_18715 [Saprolegnia parasitica CBS 223.65]KDO15743.1 hypothetical protein SPRG_18715 [Saprolegnia parasitica CBS 223.65]|eukprot:XP_012213549.1 hypothetical protein SPRG_18715 [Saprolegnia parasitica CBS 223.65]